MSQQTRSIRVFSVWMVDLRDDKGADSRPQRMSGTPEWANAWAVAVPTPPVAPVTITTLFPSVDAMIK